MSSVHTAFATRFRNLTNGRKRIVFNFGWLMFGHGLTIVNGVVIGGLVARHLGPRNLGILAFATSLIAMLTPIMNLGLDRVIVREYVQNPDRRASYFWTAFWMRLLISTIIFSALVGLLVAGIIPTSGDTETLVLTIMLLTCFSGPLLTAKLVLEATVNSKYAVVNQNCWLLVAATLNLALVSNTAGLVSFSLLKMLTALVTALSLSVILYRKQILPRVCRPQTVIAGALFAECWPLLLSGLSVAIYMNVDISMLRYMLGADDAGEYSIAARLSSMMFVIPVALASSFFPTLARLYAGDSKHYHDKLAYYLRLNALTAYSCVLFSLLFVPKLIRLLYGEQFEGSVSVFQYHIWCLPFVFLGVARGQHLILARRHRFGLMSTSFGLITNVGLNLLLIPEFGTTGAAISTFVSYAVAAWITSFLCIDSGTNLGVVQTQSLLRPIPW